jgi:hypothetical protein
METVIKLGLEDKAYNLVPNVNKNWITYTSPYEKEQENKVGKVKGKFSKNARSKLLPPEGQLMTNRDRL